MAIIRKGLMEVSIEDPLINTRKMISKTPQEALLVAGHDNPSSCYGYEGKTQFRTPMNSEPDPKPRARKADA